MALRLDDKKAIVAEVNGVAQKAISAVVAEYRGLNVTDMTELRNQLRAQNVVMRVVRNTLARRALDGTDYACLQEAMIGPVVLMFALDHPGAAARVVKDFIKKHQQLQPTALAFEGSLMAANELEFLASLPTKDEGIALLAMVLKAPVVKFAQTTGEIYAKFARACQAVADQKQ